VLDLGVQGWVESLDDILSIEPCLQGAFQRHAIFAYKPPEPKAFVGHALKADQCISTRNAMGVHRMSASPLLLFCSVPSPRGDSLLL
jgi:hypothetical protein